MNSFLVYVLTALLFSAVRASSEYNRQEREIGNFVFPKGRQVLGEDAENDDDAQDVDSPIAFRSSPEGALHNIIRDVMTPLRDVMSPLNRKESGSNPMLKKLLKLGIFMATLPLQIGKFIFTQITAIMK